MNSKILLSLILIGLSAVAIGGAMTGAFFSDTETSKDNTFVAGEIDLKINSECHYNGNLCKDGTWQGTSPYPVPGTKCDCTWEAKDLNGKPLLSFTDIKPGDKGESTISIHVTSNPAWVCAKISGLANADNGCNEPESEVDKTCGNPGEGQGELQDNLLFDIWRDFDCENDFDVDIDKYLIQGAKVTDGVWPIADSKTGPAVKPDEKYCIAVAWTLPSNAGNIIQTDSLKADIYFEAIQERHNPNFVCVQEEPEPVCGDGLVEGDEVCDLNSQSCKTAGGYEGTQACNAECSGWEDCKSDKYCGDGITNGPEACDDGANNGQPNYCNADCTGTTTPFCGNGAVEAGEACDDGNTDNTDACLNSCVAAACGDGYKYTGNEECDNGANNGVTCTPPYGGSCDYCSVSCTTTTINGPYCGDGNTDTPDEECDGSSQSCTTAGGYSGTQACVSCALGTCTSTEYCGDGIKNGPEECDDGNNIGGDSCLPDCTLPNICSAKPDVMLVFDRSGSISPGLIALKSAAQSFVAALDPKTDGAHMGQTSFGNSGRLDLNLTGDSAAINAKIDAITASGGANLYEGLLYANQELADGLHDRDDLTSPDFMVVIVAKEPTQPGRAENARNMAKAQADAADAAGTKIYVVCVGMNDANEDWFKTNIATDLTYFFTADSFSELEAILDGIANCD